MQDSFARIKYWAEEVQKNSTHKQACLLIGNKADLPDRKVDAAEAQVRMLSCITRGAEVDLE